jgi:putative adhesin
MRPVRREAFVHAVVLGGVWTLAAAAPLRAQQKVIQRFAVTPTASIRIFGDVGSLRIVGWDRDSVVVTGTLPAGARLDASRGGDPERPSPGMKIYVEVPRSPAPDAKLELRVPSRARVWSKSGSANIEVTGLTGGLDLNIVGGSARIVCSPAELQVESMDGSVTIEGSPAWLRAKTATGDIVLRGGSEDAGLSTVSGAVRVGEGRFERAKFTSVTGPIVFAGDLARGATLDVDTHGGPIELRLAPRLDAEFDVATVTGSIENTLTTRRPIAGREGRGMELGFTSGTGRARILVRSFKGNIYLRAR